jgi:Surfeit locus protein 5 subunit 22 of Mediator complex
MDRSQPAASTNIMGAWKPITRLRIGLMNKSLDTHERLIADILTRYRTLMMLATIQAEGERTNEKPEAIAVASISMKMEFDGLVCFPLSSSILLSSHVTP